MNKLIYGHDVLFSLAQIETESAQCVVTSPPYWGLRNYKVAGQIGLEKSPNEYVSKLVQVFSQVKRVLKSDGILWLNLGDSYAGSGKGGNPEGSLWTGFVGNRDREDSAKASKPIIPNGLKRKDLVGIPWRVAFALQADGWYLRRDIIWSKPNPMPESVTDRCTSSHEYIFMLTKSAKYYYNAEAIREPMKDSTIARPSQNVEQQVGSERANGGRKANGNTKAVGHIDKQRGHSRHHNGFNDRWDHMEKSEQQINGANRRSVWTIAPQPYAEAHFATFPEQLPRLCILASTKPRDLVLDPFSGSGTTCAVASGLDRQYIGLDLNADYLRLAETRIARADKTIGLELT